MSKTIRTIISATLVVLVGGGSGPVVANPAATFHDIDYADSGNTIYISDQSLVRDLAPIGAPIDEAFRSLEAAGARPRKPSPNGDRNLVYYSTDVVENVPRDVALFITLKDSEGAVWGVKLDRISYGS